MTLRLVIELGKAKIVPKKQLSVFLIESLPSKHFIIGQKLKSIDKLTLRLTNDVFINKNLTPANNRITVGNLSSRI